jgi:hypothetical protein
MSATGWHDASNGSGGDGGDGPVGPELLEARVTALEGTLLAMAREVRTRRLVVVDDAGVPRLVAEVVEGTAELRLSTAMARRGRGTAVVLHAGAGPDGEDERVQGRGLGALMGLQLWAEGDALVELDAWPGPDGQWRPHLHLGGPS